MRVHTVPEDHRDKIVRKVMREGDAGNDGGAAGNTAYQLRSRSGGLFIYVSSGMMDDTLLVIQNGEAVELRAE